LQQRERERLAAEEAQRRERERLAAAGQGAASAGQDRNAAGAGAGSGAGRTDGLGSGSAPGNAIPRSMLDSDMTARARDAVRGLGVLSGRPPRAMLERDFGARRVLAGRAIREVPLKMYVENWRQKIERNGQQVYSSYSGPRVDLVVIVSVRSDGSVEDVSFVRSSGRDDIDEAVRSIVRLNARYSAFPPNVAANYDVIQIRRVWSFGSGLRVMEEAN
jgi:outer membrane biosynthesis protein TonB